MFKLFTTSTAQLALFAAMTFALLATAAPASSQSHLMQPAEEHVLLHFFTSGGGVCPAAEGGTLVMYRVLPDGSTKLFEVPKERVLVVTDFNVRGYVPSGSGSARSALHTIFRLTSSSKGFSGTVVYRSSFHLNNDLDAKGFTITGDMRGGIAVGSGLALCPAMEMDDGSQNTETLTVTAGNLRGYLIDAKP